MLNKSGLLYIICFTLVFTNIGCGNTNKTSADIPNPSATIASTPSNLANQTDKIKFKTETGSEFFSLKLQTDGAKLVDAKNNEIVKIQSEQSGKVKIKNASDKILGYIVTQKGNWKLDSEQNKVLYTLKLENNGNYQLEDSANKEVYKINSTNNDLLIQANNKLVYKVKIKEHKISLRDASGKTVFSTKSNITPIAFACFGFDILTREQQAALAYAVNLTGGK